MLPAVTAFKEELDKRRASPSHTGLLKKTPKAAERENSEAINSCFARFDSDLQGALDRYRIIKEERGTNVQREPKEFLASLIELSKGVNSAFEKIDSMRERACIDAKYGRIHKLFKQDFSDIEENPIPSSIKNFAELRQLVSDTYYGLRAMQTRRGNAAAAKEVVAKFAAEAYRMPNPPRGGGSRRLRRTRKRRLTRRHRH